MNAIDQTRPAPRPTIRLKRPAPAASDARNVLSTDASTRRAASASVTADPASSADETVSSTRLLGPRKRLTITHGDKRYVLRVTARGRLLLTAEAVPE